MASITTWMRLEPHARAADMEAGLEMRVHDPLWMLARQWQFGEFQGEDTGSPVWAAVSGSEAPINLYLPGPLDQHTHDDVQAYSPEVPLEVLVERERTSGINVMLANRRLAVDAGQHFLRLLGSLLGESFAGKYRAVLLRTHGVVALTADERQRLDPDSIAFLDLMAGRALDGAQLLLTIQQYTTLEAAAAALGFESGDVAQAVPAITAWLDWCERMVGPVSTAADMRPAWNPERMEYTCALGAPQGAAGDQVVLTATEYPGGHLDWHSFDVAVGQKLNRDPSITAKPYSTATPPTGLSFRGMPSNRLWEFEDAQVRFGSIQAAATDLARLLLVEFLVEYGNDFFTIPIELAAGSLFNVEVLMITNTFGDVVSATPFADQNWRMFALATSGTSTTSVPPSMLFLPPALGQHLESPPLEDLHLLRDEMANMAWAVEHVVTSPSGKPLNRHEVYQARRQREQGDRPPVGEGTLIYRLDTWQSSLPDYWIPLLPEQSTPGEAYIQLKCYDPQGLLSRGRLLAERSAGATALYLFDEEVPRAGAHVIRSQQYTRWYGGSTFAWIGREKRPGRGEGTSGLRHDVAEVVELAG